MNQLKLQIETERVRKLIVRTMCSGDTIEIVKRFNATPKLGQNGAPKPLGLYRDMPEFHQPKIEPFATFEIETTQSKEQLSDLLEQKITDKTKSVWYPKRPRNLGPWAWVDDSGLRPRCPIYVISKGRPHNLTSRALMRMGADFSIVVEPSEAEAYSHYGDRVIVGDFDTTTRSSIPVRNYVDSIAECDRYWLIDDNIEDFNILNRNKKYVCRTPAIFRAAEDFFSRFSNLGMAGFNYYSFAKSTEAVPPYCLNTRIYSCTLMHKKAVKAKVDGAFWRGRYNEDTDLSLRVLKAGYCTMLLNTFLAGKVTTQRLKGGNTDSVYVDDDDRKAFAESLQQQHPDVAKVVRRYNRWHHHVDYTKFTQQPKEMSYTPTDYKFRLDPLGKLINLKEVE